MLKFKYIIYILIILLNLKDIYFILLNLKDKLKMIHGDWGLGIGDWGLGIGDWGQSTIPNPQSPIPI